MERRSQLVWLLLVAITGGYLALDGSSEHRASTVVTVAVIGLALVKIRFIFREFMRVRHAPPLLCRLTDLWVVIIGAVLLGSYIAGLTTH